MTTATMEVYDKEEMLQAINDWFGLSDYETVMKQLETETRCRNFGDYTQVPVIKENKSLISIKEFFEENDYYEGEKLSVEAFEELLGSHGEWTVRNHDNTYNYSGKLANEMDFHVIESEMDDTTVVLFAVHVGLDVRAGYTKAFAIQFDNYEEFIEMYTNRFELGYATFMQDEKEFSVAIQGEAMSEYYSLYISDESNNEYPENYSQEEWDLCLDSEEEIIESVEKYLSDNEIPFVKGSVKVPE
ncbi:hypothetical protein [Vagococcus fluvialis]|uniref:hypothetical protein n=1 Tax=Vagococcus fluvialis TaxID=2738 RepID=UPI001D0AF258|nr:hypothetical protein [Vagococcus fluvialis]UDM72766.1 hypothetical protein K5L00_14525 [Vagococcus fluvialis]UDM78322.1 hypothetical protein K5K98_14730 [Vagococcus fluvialis]UDM84041.1 hypothetical protein K5K96_14550 [Vagococcus fluvialis]